jgi:hypothetical protein
MELTIQRLGGKAYLTEADVQVIQAKPYQGISCPASGTQFACTRDCSWLKPYLS